MIGPVAPVAIPTTLHGSLHARLDRLAPTREVAQSAQRPASGSRPLHAGRRLPSHQAPDRLIPVGPYASGFDDIWILNDASSVGLLSFVSRTHICSRSSLELWLQRSPPRLFTAAAWSDLRPAPESRSGGARPHPSHSFTTRFFSLSLLGTSFPGVSAAHYSQKIQTIAKPGVIRRQANPGARGGRISSVDESWQWLTLACPNRPPGGA